MQDFAVKILREKDPPTLPAPEDRHVKVALAAFDGDTIGQIRAEFPKTSVQMIGQSIRMTRDAIRRGQAPELVKEQFPGLVEEQKFYGATGNYPKKPSKVSQELNKITVKMKAVEFTSVRDFIDLCRQAFAPVGVPLTMQKIAEGVEREDPAMIKLSAELFGMTGRKGGGINQQFNIGEVKGSKPEVTRFNPEKRTAYFEGLVRRARAELVSENPAAANVVDVEEVESSEEPDDDDE